MIKQNKSIKWVSNLGVVLGLVLGLGFLAQEATAKALEKMIDLEVTDKGFVPGEIKVAPGSHVILKVTRKTDVTCATEIKIAQLNIKKDLPLGKEVLIDLGQLKKGDIRFACGMSMVSGHIILE